jgi:hypothetical protein
LYFLLKRLSSDLAVADCIMCVDVFSEPFSGRILENGLFFDSAGRKRHWAPRAVLTV